MTKEKTSFYRIIVTVGIIVGIASTIFGFVFGGGKATARVKMQLAENTKDIAIHEIKIDKLEDLKEDVAWIRGYLEEKPQ